MLNKAVLQQLMQYKIDGAEGFLSNYEGERKSRQKGQSQEFSDFRPYNPGDDIRLIDWNAYARTDQYYVKLYEEEREARITIVLDHSASMGLLEKKRKLSEELVLIISYVALAAGDSVRIITQGHESIFVETEYIKGLSQYYRVQQTLDKIEWVSEINFETLAKETSFTKGITVWISDLLFENFEGVHQHFRMMKQHVLALQVLSDETMDPEYEGMLELEDVESGALVEVHCTKRMMESYHEALKSHQDRIQHLLTGAGHRHVVLNVDSDEEKHVLQKLLVHNILR